MNVKERIDLKVKLEIEREKNEKLTIQKSGRERENQRRNEQRNEEQM